jgi:hypothetical protein
MKLIPLTQGKFAMVDDVWFDWLVEWKWNAIKDGNNWYAGKNLKVNGKWFLFKMHRVILGVTDPKIVVDHKDRNGLNNQLSNIRPCTTSMNGINRRSFGKSKFIGVSLVQAKRPSGTYFYWRAAILADGKVRHLGMFKSELEAAMAHYEAAKKYYGDFAEAIDPMLVVAETGHVDRPLPDFRRAKQVA